MHRFSHDAIDYMNNTEIKNRLTDLEQVLEKGESCISTDILNSADYKTNKANKMNNQANSSNDHYRYTTTPLIHENNTPTSSIDNTSLPTTYSSHDKCSSHDTMSNNNSFEMTTSSVDKVHTNTSRLNIAEKDEIVERKDRRTTSNQSSDCEAIQLESISLDNDDKGKRHSDLNNILEPSSPPLPISYHGTPTYSTKSSESNDSSQSVRGNGGGGGSVDSGSGGKRNIVNNFIEKNEAISLEDEKKYERDLNGDDTDEITLLTPSPSSVPEKGSFDGFEAKVDN